MNHVRREPKAENIRVRLTGAQRLALTETLLARGFTSEAAAIRDAIEQLLARQAPKGSS